MVGLDNRATLDIDTTVRNLSLSIENTERIITEIINIPMKDGITFYIKSLNVIMDEAKWISVKACPRYKSAEKQNSAC